MSGQHRTQCFHGQDSEKTGTLTAGQLLGLQMSPKTWRTGVLCPALRAAGAPESLGHPALPHQSYGNSPPLLLKLIPLLSLMGLSGSCSEAECGSEVPGFLSSAGRAELTGDGEVPEQELCRVCCLGPCVGLSPLTAPAATVTAAVPPLPHLTATLLSFLHRGIYNNL